MGKQGGAVLLLLLCNIGCGPQTLLDMQHKVMTQFKPP
jgi:hypothetical protein